MPTRSIACATAVEVGARQRQWHRVRAAGLWATALAASLSVHADVLFVDTNNAPLEIQAVQRTLAPGEKLWVIPSYERLPAKQREQASRELSMAEQRAQQLADAKAQQVQSRAPPPGNPNSSALHNASYIAALQAAILRQWTRPESVRIGQQCQVLIRQIPGGEVVSVQVSPSCPYDELGRRSVEAAVLKASPLPYAGYEDAFVRDPVFTFRAEDQ